MKVTVATLSDTVFTLEVASDMEVENFKALCEVESGIPAAEMVLLFNGQVPWIHLVILVLIIALKHPLQPMVGDKKSLAEIGVGDGDMVMLDRY